MTISEYFRELHKKDIICWGSGKHFRNSTYPFLKKGGFLANLKGIVDPSGSTDILLEEQRFRRLGKEDLAVLNPKRTVILVAVTGYEEIMNQLEADAQLAAFEAVPAMYLEALYEDIQLLSVEKPPVGYRKHDTPQIPRVIHAIWFSDNPLPALYQRCLASWRKYAPDFEIKIWTLDTYQPGRCLFYEQALAHKNWAFASDYARADLLRRYGGIYIPQHVGEELGIAFSKLLLLGNGDYLPVGLIDVQEDIGLLHVVLRLCQLLGKCGHLVAVHDFTADENGLLYCDGPCPDVVEVGVKAGVDFLADCVDGRRDVNFVGGVS